MVTSSDALTGMKEICGYINRSEPTVLDLIRKQDFPAKKIGGVWESSKSLVDTWRKATVYSDVFNDRQAHL